MEDNIWFIGLPYDDDRDRSTPADQQRLAEDLEGQGFKTEPTKFGSLEVWLPGGSSAFLASVHLADNWMVQIGFLESQLDEAYDENRGNPMPWRS